MSVFQKAQLTLYGLNRIAEAHVGERMVFTSIGFGDEALTGNLSEVTELSGEKQRFPISGSKVSGNNFWASCKPVKIEDPNGIYLRAIGLYIADPEHESDRSCDKLYSVASIIPDFGEGADYIAYIPQDPENAEINYDIRLNTIISPSALVKIVGGIGSFGIATISNLGLVKSNDEMYGVSVDPETGKQTVNGLQELGNRTDILEQRMDEGGNGTGGGGDIVPSPFAIYVSSLPYKSAYEEDEEFDPAGLVVKGIFAGGSEAVIYPESPPGQGQNGYILSLPDMATVGNKTVTVSYRNITTSFPILVAVAPPVVLTGIEIAEMPDKTVYEPHENLDISGIAVNAVFSNGSKTALSYNANGIDGYKCSSPDMSIVGNKTVTVSYMPDGDAFTQTFAIEVCYGSDWDGVVDNVTETNQNLLMVFGVATAQEAWERTHERINADGLSNYHGMGLGDYIDITEGLPAPLNIAWNASYVNLRIYILGFNIYKGTQGNTKNEILWGFKNVVLQRQMNTTPSCIGGYPAMPIKSFLDGDFLTALTAALGADYFYSVRRLVSTPGGDTDSAVMEAKIWIANAKEVFGEATKGRDPAPQVSIPMYVKDSDHKIKSYNGSRPNWWWTASPANLEDADSEAGANRNFRTVYDGNSMSSNNQAHSSGYGIAPCFCQK